MRRIQWMVIFWAATVWGCAHPISQSMRTGAQPDIPFPALAQSPKDYVDKTVVLGGTIVETRNLPEGTEIEVVQKDLDLSGYPAVEDQTGGRFIFFHRKYLESEIYSKGRVVTGAGKVLGSKPGTIGGQNYDFPLVEAEELHLWIEYDPRLYHYPPYWDPFYRPYYHSPFHRYYW